MRTCAGFSIFLMICAVILVIFGLIGQLSSALIPRSIYAFTLSTQGLDSGLIAASNSLGGGGSKNLNFSSIYFDNNNLNQNGKWEGRRNEREARHDGLRRLYQFGFFGYCATSGSAGSPVDYCTSNDLGYKLAPTVTLLNDLPSEFQEILNSTLPSNTFTAVNYLNSLTHVSSILLFTGFILTLLTFLSTLFSHHILFLISAILSLLSFLFLLIPLTIYTVVIAKAMDSINGVMIQVPGSTEVGDGVPIGLHINWGNSIWIMWSAVGVLLFSVIPLSAACIMGRNSRKLDY